MKRLFWLPILALVMVASPVLACETSSGEVQKLDATKRELIVSTECDCGSGKIIQMTFTINETTKVQLNGREAKLADLKQGDRVEIEYDALDDVEKVSATRDS